MSFYQFIMRELLLPSLAVKVRSDYFDRASVIEGMKKDKKRTGIGLALVMMGDNNQMYRVHDLTEQEAGKALDVASDQLR